MVEFFFWDAPMQDKLTLSMLYGPYLALCQFPFHITQTTGPLAEESADCITNSCYHGN
jgi:hypothetical protein